MRKTKLAVTAAAAITAIASSGVMVAIPVAASTSHAPQKASWRIVKGVGGPDSRLEFSAITVTSPTSAWAFTGAFGADQPHAFELTHGAWLQMGFPDRRDETVYSASSSSASNVWAVTFNPNHLTGKVYWFNGHKWTRVLFFNGVAGPILALSPANAWLFGTRTTKASHYNGRTWTASSGSRGLSGASALSADSIWAFGTKTVAHWNGHNWTRTSVAKQLPRDNQVCSSRLTGIYAASARNVYAIGTGGCQDQLGPFVLLHYNGSKWSRLVLDRSLGEPIAVIGDGRGGLWIPAGTGSPPVDSIEHYGSGKLTTATLPVPPGHLALSDAAIGKHTTTAYAVGFTRKSLTSGITTGVILRYGP